MLACPCYPNWGWGEPIAATNECFADWIWQGVSYVSIQCWNMYLFNHKYDVMYVVCQCAVSLPQEYQSLCNEYRCSPMQACALAFFLTNPHPRTRYCCEAVRLWITNLDIVSKKLAWPDWLRIFWLSTVTMVFRTYKSGEIYKPTKEHLDDAGWSSAPHHTLNIDI